MSIFPDWVMRTTKDGKWFHDSPNPSDIVRREYLEPYFNKQIDVETNKPVTLKKCVDQYAEYKKNKGIDNGKTR